MNFKEWLKWANKNRFDNFGLRLMPSLKLMDGTIAYVQAGERWRCFPQIDLTNGNWDSVEVLTARKEDVLEKYIHKGVTIGYIDYDYVPVEDMENYCKIHGGIKCPENFN